MHFAKALDVTADKPGRYKSR